MINRNDFKNSILREVPIQRDFKASPVPWSSFPFRSLEATLIVLGNLKKFQRHFI